MLVVWLSFTNILNAFQLPKGNHKQDQSLYKSFHTFTKQTSLHTLLQPIEIDNMIQMPISSNIMSNISNEFVQILNILFVLGQTSFLVIFFISIFRMFVSQFNNNMSMGDNPFTRQINVLNNKKFSFENPNVRLNEWAGSPEVIDECKDIINYLENKKLYEEYGAQVPKGILLEGPPGTGKTLLAKAIATETNSTFISTSGSEFIELFVGMGAARVRELFRIAREKKPSIIFIDEIDAVGRQRGAGVNLGNDEREQTLNQLLFEMDGFKNNSDIIVLAATNRKDVLDQALLRPGRFDRLIRVPLPDKYSRKQILELLLNSKPFDTSQIKIDLLAEITEGLSGAQLNNLINEALIIMIKSKQNTLNDSILTQALEKTLVGLIKKNDDRGLETKKRVAIHECGHALITALFSKEFELQKISIESTYNGAGGYTLFTEKDEMKDGGLYTKSNLKKRLMITLGGKAAETIIYGNEYVSLGAYEDLRQANRLAQKMIGNFGMGTELEVFFNENIDLENNVFLGKTLASGEKYSDSTKSLMDQESLQLINEAFSNAKMLINTRKNVLIELSSLLLENKVLYQDDFSPIFNKMEKN